jgi:selenocysteine lyase/cysteine desulfurase
MSTLYLNHAGTSWPKPPAVHAAVIHATRAGPEQWGGLFQDAHERVAAHFGVAAQDLLLTPGCTSALSVAVADVPIGLGQRVVTSGMEHHALMRPLLKRGVPVDTVGRSEEGPFDLDALQRALDEGGVQLVAVSMASNVTGELLPIEQIVDLAHQHDALCLVDGAQVAGWMPLALQALQVDLFAFAGHKGPQAPTGIGGLYVRPGVHLDTPAAVCEGGVCRTGPGYCDTGSVDLPALCGLAAGLDWMAARAPLDSARACALRFEELVVSLPGLQVVGGTGPRMPTCSVVVPGHDPVALAVKLARFGVITRGGTQCAPATHATLGTGSAGTLRVSFGPQSTLGDAERAAQAVAAIVA